MAHNWGGVGRGRGFPHLWGLNAAQFICRNSCLDMVRIYKCNYSQLLSHQNVGKDRDLLTLPAYIGEIIGFYILSCLNLRLFPATRRNSCSMRTDKISTGVSAARAGRVGMRAEKQRSKDDPSRSDLSAAASAAVERRTIRINFPRPCVNQIPRFRYTAVFCISYRLQGRVTVVKNVSGLAIKRSRVWLSPTAL